MIYTYSNPYKLGRESYFSEIRDLPEFCSSQTLATGLLYGGKVGFCKEQLNTVDHLLEALYERWESRELKVKQHSHIDAVLRQMEFSEVFESISEEQSDLIREALNKNRTEILESIRLLIELDIDLDQYSGQLTQDQQLLAILYRKLRNSQFKEDFELPTNLDEEQIQNAIRRALIGDREDISLDKLNLSRVVFHGIHQFSPLLLRAIQEINRHMDVILLFNYQSAYADLYQTWLNVYSGFKTDEPILYGEAGGQMHPLPGSPSYESNQLGEQLGKLFEGNLSDLNTDGFQPVLEFDNLTEFANYVSDRFTQAVARKNSALENAEQENQTPNNPLRYMVEQFYATDLQVNEILKTYYPEQFGEIDFLNYPIGHFFVAMAELWDERKQDLFFPDFHNLRECLAAQIIQESAPGRLLSTLTEVEPLIEGCSTIQEMVERLNGIAQMQLDAEEADFTEQTDKVSYLRVNSKRIEELIEGLNELEKMAQMFFQVFDSGEYNFRNFYRKVRRFIDQKIQDDMLNEEFRSILVRVGKQLDEVQEIETSASFACLKSTMGIYLQQAPDPGKKAEWIVRGFNQIDGDILLSNGGWAQKNPELVYHFACLSNKGMIQNSKDHPWPLTEDFFENLGPALDWKIKVYLEAIKERANFNRYALIYGLLFNKVRYQLSYIRFDHNKEMDCYYPLKLMNLPIQSYKTNQKAGWLEPVDNFKLPHATSPVVFEEMDLKRYALCPRKFLLESLVEGTTVYQDRFLLNRFLEVLVEEKCQKRPGRNRVRQKQAVKEALNDLKNYFPYINYSEEKDIISQVEKQIKNQSKISSSKNFQEAEVFIDPEGAKQGSKELEVQGPIDDFLRRKMLEAYPFSVHQGKWCSKCASRAVCLDGYNKDLTIE